MKNIKSTFLLGASALLMWTSCQPTEPETYSELKTNVVSNYCDVVLASYTDAHAKAVDMQTALNAMVANPSSATYQAAKDAWLAAREPYGQTESYRFYDGPIDDADGPEGNLNAWPLDENYVDYTVDNGVVTQTGIINDLANFPTIDAATLSGANEGANNSWSSTAQPNNAEKNISIGYHAIEFLLWGQDAIDVNVNVGQGGQRTHVDYTSTVSNHTRRGDYIKVCAQLIIDDLAILKAEWSTGGAYRTSFMALEADEALTKIMTGIGILSKSELATERMFVALEANAVDNPQEDEHSCFADNTHRDVITNAQSIANVLNGTYVSSAGVITGNSSYSILALVASFDAAVSADLAALSSQTMNKVNAIPVPFDKAVTEENVTDNGPVMRAVNCLQSQGDKIAEAATAVGLTISTELPD